MSNNVDFRANNYRDYDEIMTGVSGIKTLIFHPASTKSSGDRKMLEKSLQIFVRNHNFWLSEVTTSLEPN